MKLNNPNAKSVAKFFNSGVLALPKIKKSVKDYRAIALKITETGLTKPAFATSIVTNAANGVLKADKAIGLAKDIVKVSEVAVVVGGEALPVMSQVAKFATLTFTLGKGLIAKDHVQQLDKLNISNFKLSQGFGYVKHTVDKDEEVSWDFDDSHLSVPFPCVCESHEELCLAVIKHGLRKENPPHRAAWWRKDIVTTIERKSVSGITGNAIPLPACLVALRYIQSKLSKKADRKLFSTVPTVGIGETLRSGLKAGLKILRKTKGLRRTAEAITLWGAARHAHEVTDFVILIKDYIFAKAVPSDFPELSSAKEAVANGCPMAQAIIACLFGGLENPKAWERAMQIICAKDGWKIIAAAMKSV